MRRLFLLFVLLDIILNFKLLFLGADVALVSAQDLSHYRAYPTSQCLETMRYERAIAPYSDKKVRSWAIDYYGPLYNYGICNHQRDKSIAGVHNDG